MLLDGARMVIRDVHTAAALGIAFIHQELNLLDNLDVAGNVLLGREPTRGGALQLIDRVKMRATVGTYLDQLGLDVSPDTPMAALSIARQQLVEIAKALSLNARLLIMDEPTSSLTLAETDRLHEVVSSLRERGVAIIYITHRLGEVRAVADRAVVLRDGANAGALARGELTHDNMIRLMVGRDIDVGPDTAGAQSGTDYFEIDGLRTQRYPQHAVSFAVGRGEILGMAGLVGAGRSEIARAIFGVEPPIAGAVRLDGQPLRIREPADAIRHGIVLVPEDRRLAGLVVDFSIRENVSLPALDRYARHGLISEAQERQAVAAVCGQLQVRASSIEVRAVTLSGGNQQKVVLAKWLAGQAEIFIFDEPTRGIDVAARRDIYELMNALVARGAGLIMVSSDLPEVLGMSDRILVMRQGRIQAEFDATTASEAAIMHAAFGVAS